MGASSALTDPARLDALSRSGLMDTSPEEIFDRAVRLATQITGRPVALLSLVDGTRQFFMAQTGLTGDAAKKRGTPLSHSFCQHVVTTQSEFIVTDAEKDPRVHDNGAVADLGVAAYLGVPVRSTDGHVMGSLCVIDNKPHDWTDTEKRAMNDLRKMVETDLALRTALRDNKMLLAEFNHRIRNLFTVFMGMVRMTARNADDVASMSEALTARLLAMDVAQRLVTPSASGPQIIGELANLSKLAALVLEPYESSSITIGADPTAVGPKAATAFALIFHELATNAVKYGALSDPDGTLNVDWHVDDDTLVVTWSETSDAIGETRFDTTGSKGSGFGTTLLKLNIEQELGGTQERVFSDGLMSLVLQIPIQSLET